MLQIIVTEQNALKSKYKAKLFSIMFCDNL